MTERVNHPPHYQTVAGIECIEVVRHFNFNRGNAIKYVWRAGEKVGSSVVEDLRKAIWYLEDEIQRVEKEEDVAAANEYVEWIDETEPRVVTSPWRWEDALRQSLFEAAPEWAQWWAVDQNGTAWWYDEEPIPLLNWGVWSVDMIRGARAQPVHPESGNFSYAHAAEGRIQLGDYPWYKTKRMRGDYSD